MLLRLTFKYVFYILEINIPSFQLSKKNRLSLVNKRGKKNPKTKLIDYNQTIIFELLTDSLTKTGLQKILLVIVLG